MADQVPPLQHYFETHGLPYLLEHTKMRTAGLQWYTAIQGALFVAWSHKPHPILVLVGLTSAISFFLWDCRNRFVFRRLREWGETHVDRALFGVGGDGRALDGINKMFEDSIRRPKLRSHTWAIRLLILFTSLGWGALAYYSLPGLPWRTPMQEALQKTVIRGAETWQFFAFIFAAVMLLVYGMIDDLVGGERLIRLSAKWKALLKAVTFLVIFYLTLLDPWMRNWLVYVLNEFIKREAH